MIHVVQYRISGPTAGMRVHRQVRGSQCWRLRAWIRYSPRHAPIDIVDGEPRRRDIDAREILVREPCPISALMGHYEDAVADLCKGTPIVIAAGFDAFLLRR